MIKVFSLAIAAISLTISLTAQRSVILDADTANEVDDLYAIFYLLSDSTVDVTSINAVQWQSSQWSTERTMEDSHRLNQVLTAEMGLNIPLRRGGEGRMYDWGNQARYSDATMNILEEARKATPKNKLNIISLGALTNVASAIFIDPSIEQNIKLYWLGSTYDFENNIIRKNDYNCMMDIQALDRLLHSQVEMHIIPINVASKTIFHYAETDAIFRGTHNLGNYLMDTWYHHRDGGRKSRTLWDLSIIYSFLYPDKVDSKTITTTRDNGARLINYIVDFDNQDLKEDLFIRYMEWIKAH